ncbi:helix-turn-helix transcriptional regulator [uncultured Nonlabens sp.]|uniref:helix-turn-helix domain-containing protein n=1 Tax=uncultured Nonlabens sp. TaxID=859306 RepID=UPI00262F9989|nr:helix-turn-helix transcriptional regulator [uncultured Nonlabens sp.]
MSFFGKNIKKIRGVKGLSQQAFADLFDLKRGTLGAYEEGRSEPKIDTIILIANYFSIAIGDMLTAELTVNQLLRFNDNLTLTPEELEREQFAQIPCITEKTAHDYIEYYDNDAFLSDLPALTLPLNVEKDFIGYTVTNLEMTTHDKGLFPKDVVVGEKVPKNVITKLNNGTVVLVVTDKTLILRRLYITDKGLVLRADHKNVDDITVDKKAVKQLWRVRYVFFRRMPDFSDSFEDKLAMLELQMKELRDSK